MGRRDKPYITDNISMTGQIVENDYSKLIWFDWVKFIFLMNQSL